jgi:hypothetical protein
MKLSTLSFNFSASCVSWDAPKLSIGVVELVRSDGILVFSWDHGCQEDKRMLACFDRIYVLRKFSSYPCSKIS